MPINYSKVKRACPVGSDTQKVYAQAQYSELWTLDRFAQHIKDHNAITDKSVILAVLVKAVDCLKECLLEGRKVQFGELGSFWVNLRSTGTDTAEEFSSQNITKVKVQYTPSATFTSLIDDATFQFVTTRKEQAEARANRNSTLDGVDVNTGSGSTSDGSDGSTGSDGSDGDDKGID